MDDPSAGEPSEPDPTPPSLPSPCLDVLSYIRYEDLSSYQSPATAEQYWSGRTAAIEYSIKSVVNEINITIHGWIVSTRYGEQLTSDDKLVKLFELLKEFGKEAVIPDVIWDPEGHLGAVRIGHVEVYVLI
jgi:hypothetical protein